MTLVNRHTYMERFRQEQKRLGIRRVSVTLTAHEYQHLHASASHFGERVTSHLKRRAFAHLWSQALLPPQLLQRLDHLSSVMRSIGNNINQMTRYSHQLQHAADIRQVLEQLRRMDLEVRAFVQGRLTHADAPAGWSSRV